MSLGPGDKMEVAIPKMVPNDTLRPLGQRYLFQVNFGGTGCGTSFQVSGA